MHDLGLKVLHLCGGVMPCSTRARPVHGLETMTPPTMGATVTSGSLPPAGEKLFFIGVSTERGSRGDPRLSPTGLRLFEATKDHAVTSSALDTSSSVIPMPAASSTLLANAYP